MGQGPGRSDARRDRPLGRIAEARKPGENPVEKRLFAAEQMAGPGDVDHQIAIGALPVHDGDDGRDIGVPVAEPRERGGKKSMVRLARHQFRTHGACVGKALALVEPGRTRRRVCRAKPQDVVALFIDDERAAESC